MRAADLDHRAGGDDREHAERWIRWPVKNDGRNIAMMWIWITVALWPKLKPQASMASGVADITRVITP